MSFESEAAFQTPDTRREALARLTLQSTYEVANALIRRRREMGKALPLPRPLERSAAMIPSLTFCLAALALGCRAREVPCGDDDEEYIGATREWIYTHPNEIQEQMDILWKDQSITAHELVGALHEAEVRCVVQPTRLEGKEYPKDVEGYESRGNIFIDVSEDDYQVNLEAFQNGKDLAAAFPSLEALRETTEYEMLHTNDPDAPNDGYSLHPDIVLYEQYWWALQTHAEILAHESGHTLLGKHSRDVIRRIQNGENPEHIDETFSWGTATHNAGNQALAGKSFTVTDAKGVQGE